MASDSVLAGYYYLNLFLFFLCKCIFNICNKERVLFLAPKNITGIDKVVEITKVIFMVKKRPFPILSAYKEFK
jgi:hypothetical protein